MHLLAASKAKARLSGRASVQVEDVMTMAPHVLGHRIIVNGVDSDAVVREAVRLVSAAA